MLTSDQLECQRAARERWTAMGGLATEAEIVQAERDDVRRRRAAGDSPASILAAALRRLQTVRAMLADDPAGVGRLRALMTEAVADALAAPMPKRPGRTNDGKGWNVGETITAGPVAIGGLRTNADKRRAVLATLDSQESAVRSNRELARQLGVGEALVRRIRAERAALETQPQAGPVAFERGGKQLAMTPKPHNKGKVRPVAG